MNLDETMLKGRRDRSAIDFDAAEAVAIQGLAFLAEEPTRMQRFFLTSGLRPEDVRAQAGTPHLLCAVLEYLASDESLLLVFAASRKVAAESVGQAIAVLQVTGS
jgi:hypothetical protein